MNINTIIEEETAKWIYEATREEAAWSNRPIVPEPWEQRDKKFRNQFVSIIKTYLSADKLPTPEEAHDSWMDAYFKMGWTYGEVRDIEKKTHPDLLPFNDLGQAERDKDAIFLAFVWLARKLLTPSDTTAMQRAYEAGEREADAKQEKGWLIWSNEHDAWWAINRIGYTRSRKMAGRYTFGQALEIVRHANCRNGDRPFEAMVEDVDDDEVAKEMGRA